VRPLPCRSANRALTTYYSDIEIAKSQTPKPIDVLAAEIGIPAHDLEMYGRYKAKVKLEVLDSLKHRR
jgi:methylenetetrahydrofolate dehydrogenase (NADP+)/methenyltetrahydrofolate cyclohydrolase/formyltetrahydrofolate synthetase